MNAREWIDAYAERLGTEPPSQEEFATLLDLAGVAACAAAVTSYVDLTGEPEFVDLMWLRYHEQAEQTGARLVHSCGFDSIPYDLGALYAVNQLPEGVPIRLEGFVRMNGTFSGGT